MKNPADVLREKEAEIQNLQRDIEALRIAIRLCSEKGDGDYVEAPRTDTGYITNPKPVRGVSMEPEKAVKQFP